MTKIIPAQPAKENPGTADNPSGSPRYARDDTTPSLRGAKRRGNPDAFKHKGLYAWPDCRAFCRASLATKGFFAMTAFNNGILVTAASLIP
ncbi:MAG: hypothetical protein Q8O64_10510 [Sideroxyarcus sp.]|nr:hypothetical protein [Sideroxyarcus sp.]